MVTRLIFAFAAVSLLTGQACASPPSAKFPLPRARPALPSDKAAKSAVHAPPLKGAVGPLLHAVPTRPLTATASISSTGARGYEASERPRSSAVLGPSAAMPPRALSMAAPAVRPAPALALAATSNTSPLDLAAI